MHQNRKGLCSIRAKQGEIKEARQYLADMNPPQLIHNTIALNMFCYAALIDTVTGIICTDISGRFPVQSVQIIQYIFVCYVYEAISILVRPMKSRSDEYFVAASMEMYKELEANGFEPTLNVIDKKCSKAFQNYYTSQNMDWLLVEPSNHRVNTAERSIQTFKNHFISGLCSVLAAYPPQLWCYLLQQA